MIDIRKLKELVKLMVANDLSEMDLRDTDEQVTIRRQGDTVVTVPAPVAIAAPVAAPVATPVASTALVDEGVEIASPMVGTFYVSQDPESPPFVSVGDSIGEDSTVCVIEAMKIFNEINAQCKGTVTKVLVSNGDPVEFGQALFLVKPH
ncbi:MAG TPA: acetyl-CoA carboxylase biotin carboxyl carrier protein [Phycisphaerales bacterium]|nr:acetyl-CoA carboxylase biotin carboxyl carrier protein [Phycisphaerales bacterium]HIB50673.1 acetyl-CoA carboxylase biotin carboxyl carrier protein [Phycisphaerales bacterium]HIN84445.1 acetyl-CoA carboxylase biotin carboxyl carrier protein [Phycisphaerales bacterium]HIO52785.1 acetyl-CoA carboxylase biotin carboxyl carrier protein [Phycisphaerales bacterium]